MKQPHEYLAPYLPPKHQGSQTIVFVKDAEQALAQALEDARQERYRLLLSQAIRNAKNS